MAHNYLAKEKLWGNGARFRARAPASLVQFTRFNKILRQLKFNHVFQKRRAHTVQDARVRARDRDPNSIQTGDSLEVLKHFLK